MRPTDTRMISSSSHWIRQAHRWLSIAFTVTVAANFIARIKETCTCQPVGERPLSQADQAAGVLIDQEVRVGSEFTAGELTAPVRRLVIESQEGRRLVLLTDSTLPAQVIADLYRFRWQVELFFRWFKCILGCTHWLSRSRQGLTLQDFDYYEIHEAFAAQVLCTLRAWESADYCKQRLGLDAPLGSIDPAKLNVHGSSLATGHPFAATGARIIATLAKLLEQKGSGRGLISICTAGGMGVTAILER